MADQAQGPLVSSSQRANVISQRLTLWRCPGIIEVPSPETIFDGMEKAGGDRSDKSGGPGTNRWMKEQGKYRYLVFRPLCACGRKVSVHQFDPRSPLRFGVSFDLSPDSRFLAFQENVD